MRVIRDSWIRLKNNWEYSSNFKTILYVKLPNYKYILSYFISFRRF
jgi:hypothetical protein